MQLSRQTVFMFIGFLSVLLVGLWTLAPSTSARPVTPDVTVVHSSLINVSPPDPRAGELVTFEMSDPTATGQFMADIEWDLPDGSSPSGVHRTRVQHRFHVAGVYTVGLRIETLSPYQIIRASTNVDVRPSEGSSSLGGEVNMRAVIKSYDDDGDNRLDNAELTSVVNAWVSGQMTNETFIEALDLWVHQATIVRLNASSTSVPIRLTHHGNRRVTVSTDRQDASKLQLWLYDQSGQELLARESIGHRLTVDLGLVHGRALPNGVYLAKVRIQGPSGATTRAMKKLAVMR